MLNIFVPGDPRPQGSKRHVGNGIMIEASKHVKDWRGDIRSALTTEGGTPKAFFEGEVCVTMVFVLRRPKSAPKTKPMSAAKKPDLDKLIRAVLDAVSSAGLWNDDCQVVGSPAYKRVAALGETPGLHLQIQQWSDRLSRTIEEVWIR